MRINKRRLETLAGLEKKAPVEKANGCCGVLS